MGVKSLVTSFGQITGAPSDSSSLDAIIGVELLSVAVNTVLTGTDNKKVFVDTSLAPISITLPSGTRGQTIDVIDGGDNAGTNIITIIGTIDGASNTTIETNGGSRCFVFDAEWESGGGIERFFTRNAAQGRITSKDPDLLVADQLYCGETGSIYSATTASFSNAEANVDQGSSGWGNLLVYEDILAGGYQTNDSSPYEVTTLDNLGGNPGWQAFDNVASTSWAAQKSLSPWVKIDFATGRSIASFSLSGSSFVTQSPRDFKLQASNDNSAWTDVSDVSNASFGAGASPEYATNSGLTTYRYWRLLVTEVQGVALYAEIRRLTLNEATFQTTNNTFQYRPLTGGSSTSFDPSSFTAIDENASSLANGDILIEYSLDQGSSWPGGQRSLNDFKALGVLTGTDFWLRFEMVGAKKLGSATIETASSYAEMTTNELSVSVNSTIIANIGSKGISPISLTTSERDALSSVRSGAIIFNETTSKLNFWNGSAWEAITSA